MDSAQRVHQQGGAQQIDPAEMNGGIQAVCHADDQIGGADCGQHRADFAEMRNAGIQIGEQIKTPLSRLLAEVQPL